MANVSAITGSRPTAVTRHGTMSATAYLIIDVNIDDPDELMEYAARS